MKIIVLILLTSSLAFPSYGSPIKVTIHTNDANRPYSYKENGKVMGSYVDIIRAAFDKMPDYDVTIKAVPWKRGKQLMEEGSALGLNTAYFHGHDWPYLYPYSLPYASDVLNIYCTKETMKTPRPNWPESYKNLKIGRPSGFGGWGGAEFDALVKKKEIKLDESKGVVKQILKIGAGRVQCIIMDETSYNVGLNSSIKSGKYNKKWEQPVIGIEISRNEIYIGYSKKAIESGKYPFHMDFRQKFDAEIFKMIRSGERDRILSK